MIHKCDICKKQIKHDKLTIGYGGMWTSHELCMRCSKPMFSFLKKHKLITEEEHQKIVNEKA
ncbi:hypothetical protein BK004_03295 [bacterium CG10_46_32]|nr:MAG: hypothetical protein BK004_03295 [bacterium CG10_46_32]